MGVGVQKNRIKRNGRDVFRRDVISPPPRLSGVEEFFQQFIKKGLTSREEPLSNIRMYKLQLLIRGFLGPRQRTIHALTLIMCQISR